MMTGDKISIHFVHSSPTPHNNYLLDTLAKRVDIELFRHFLFKPTHVPERVWNTLNAGEVQREKIRVNVSKYLDFSLIKLALFGRREVFFVVGWDHLILVLILLIIGVRRRPLIMWDDGPAPEAIHKINSWHLRHILKRLVIRSINNSTGSFFYTGEIAKTGIIALGIDRHKLVQMPFFVKPGVVSEDLRREHCCDAGYVFILAGGRLIPQKGYDVLINALAILKMQGCFSWKATIIGSGSEKKYLTDLALRLGIDDQISFVEWAEPDVFASYIHSCDIFVAPARFDHFPTTVIASMQAGRAVVATENVGSAEEFIESGVNGLIVPADDTGAMAKALRQLIENANLRDLIAAAGQKTIDEWPVERGVQLIVNAAKGALHSCVAS